MWRETVSLLPLFLIHNHPIPFYFSRHHLFLYLPLYNPFLSLSTPLNSCCWVTGVLFTATHRSRRYQRQWATETILKIITENLWCPKAAQRGQFPNMAAQGQACICISAPPATSPAEEVPAFPCSSHNSCVHHRSPSVPFCWFSVCTAVSPPDLAAILKTRPMENKPCFYFFPLSCYF